MRIALDARTIYRPHRRGTGKNLIDLYRHVTALQSDWHIDAYHREPGPIEDLLPAANVQPHHIDMPGDRFDAWQRWRLPIAAKLSGADVLHCPANTCPGWFNMPTVVTIHDLIPLDMDAGLTGTEVRRFHQSIHTACRQAARIICPSSYTRDRLIAQFNAQPGRIDVIPWAPDSSVAMVCDATQQAVMHKYRVTDPFVLHFGSGCSRKNTRRLIAAWAALDDAIRADWQLLVVGLHESHLPEFNQILQRFGVQGSVRLHGFAGEADLPALLSAASVLAYPSLSEGFGLPILDAWATDTAVLTSNSTSLPEVAGDAAVQVDPQSTPLIAEGLTGLLTSPQLRRTLIERGHSRLRGYTWQATAERFIRTMHAAAGRPLTEAARPAMAA